MAGSGDRAELERRLRSYRNVNQWWPLNYTKSFVDDRSDLSHLPESVGLSSRYFIQLADKSPRLIAGRGCGTAATLKNMGFSAQEARTIAANVIHYGRPSIRGGHPVQWINFSLHQESTQEIIFRSTAEVMAIFNRTGLAGVRLVRSNRTLSLALQAGGLFVWAPDGFGRLDPMEAQSSAMVIARLFRRATVFAKEAKAYLQKKEAALQEVASKGEAALRHTCALLLASPNGSSKSSSSVITECISRLNGSATYV